MRWAVPSGSSDNCSFPFLASGPITCPRLAGKCKARGTFTLPSTLYKKS